MTSSPAWRPIAPGSTCRTSEKACPAAHRMQRQRQRDNLPPYASVPTCLLNWAMVRASAIAALVVFLGCVSAPMQDTPNESRQVQAIVRTTASPFCAGKTLDSCPSPKAGDWRRDIQDWVGAGVPEPEIRSRLQARVPDFDLSIPPVKSGWVIPVIAIALSTWWLVAMARRFRGRGVSARRGESRSRDLALDTRLDEELARLD